MKRTFYADLDAIAAKPDFDEAAARRLIHDHIGEAAAEAGGGLGPGGLPPRLVDIGVRMVEAVHAIAQEADKEGKPWKPS